MGAVPITLAVRRPAAASPIAPEAPGTPLVDTHGRVHRDLRISLTDRCSLRCTYCMPEQGNEWLARASILTLDEIVQVARETGFADVAVAMTEDIAANFLGDRPDGLRASGGEALLVARR